MPDPQTSKARGAVVDGAIVIGAGLLTYGAGLIYTPAGFLTLGALLLGFGITAARSK